jgi:hypothetical protein
MTDDRELAGLDPFDLLDAEAEAVMGRLDETSRLDATLRELLSTMP